MVTATAEAAAGEAAAGAEASAGDAVAGDTTGEGELGVEPQPVIDDATSSAAAIRTLTPARAA